METRTTFVLLALLVAAFFLFDLPQYLAFEAVKSRVDSFSSWWASEPWLVGSSFFGGYVVVVALSLPGAAVMTLAAGALLQQHIAIIVEQKNRKSTMKDAIAIVTFGFRQMSGLVVILVDKN